MGSHGWRIVRTSALTFVLGYIFAYLHMSIRSKRPFTAINLTSIVGMPCASGRKQRETCLDPKGPQPWILMTLGRSGSGSTWQIIGNLTGYETPSEEYTGGGLKKSQIFFEINGGNNNDRWLLKNLCSKQLDYPEAGVVGFKWKPWETIYTPSAQAGLRLLSTLRDPTIKVVRNRRNLLDVVISKYKHKMYKGKQAPSHCLKGDEECLQTELAAGTGLILPTDDLILDLRELKKMEDEVDNLLKVMSIPHVQVSYEKLYYSGDDTEEWMRIFRFLGIGPAAGLSRKTLEGAMEHVATHNPTQEVTLRNFENVSRLLEGSEFQELLH